MKKTEFNKRVNGIVVTMRNEFAGEKFEPCRNWFGQSCSVFQYAATSEVNMERRLNENGKERQTTFMSDLSIGEYVSGADGVLDTMRNAMKSWKDDEIFMAEFVLCVNWKSWEHHARKNVCWVKFYSMLYELVRDLVYDYYEGDNEKVAYVWAYLD